MFGKIVLIALSSVLFCGVSRAERKHQEIKRFRAPEAKQGIAVDDQYCYVVSNFALGKYGKSDGVKVAFWECPEGDPLIHMNDGFLHQGKLYASHSNYPGVPSTSSVEIFDTANLKHIGSHSFGHGYGSLTWLDRKDGFWYACFVYYGNRAAEPAKDPSWTQVVKFDEQWQRLAAWVFPAELVERFGDYGCSGGSFGPDGRIYGTGHDRTELYVMEIPQAGSVLKWVDTIKIPAEGQAFGWDPSEPWLLWSILKKNREVILGRVDPPAVPGKQISKPNIIFIMADDLGYGDLGCYGGKKILTPHIDKLAEDGTRYTQFYSGSPVCAPARCVLMTGLHSGHARIRGNGPQVGGELEQFGEGSMRLSLIGDEATVASVLKEAGYATGAAGKWGIGEPTSEGTPTQMGFDEWLGYLNQNHASYYYTDFLWRNREKMAIPENQNGKRQVYSNDLMRDFALEFIRRNNEGLFFLYLPFTIPHALMEVPSLGPYEEKDWPESVKIYAAMVSRLDGYIGEIMEELERLGITEETLVMFTSDNGAVDNDRTVFLDSAAGKRGRKGTVYEGGLNVPLIIKWPGTIAAGAIDHTPWMFMDMLPTLAEVAGTSIPPGLDGVSLLPALLGEPQDLSERFIYWEFPRSRLWQAGRVGNWKGIRFGTDGPLELYDLKNDPNETQDIAGEHQDLVAQFEQHFDAEHEPSPHWPVN